MYSVPEFCKIYSVTVTSSSSIVNFFPHCQSVKEINVAIAYLTWDIACATRQRFLVARTNFIFSRTVKMFFGSRSFDRCRPEYRGFSFALMIYVTGCVMHIAYSWCLRLHTVVLLARGTEPDNTCGSCNTDESDSVLRVNCATCGSLCSSIY